MANIIQPESVASSNYSAVAYRYGNSYAIASLTDGNISLSQIGADGCSTGYKALWAINTAKNQVQERRCYKFPDPLGEGKTRYTGKYLAYIYNVFNGSSNNLLLEPDSRVPKTYRMAVAKESAKEIAASNRSMRIGLATFNKPSSSDPGPGGSILRDIKDLTVTAGVSQSQADQNFNNLVSSIDGLAAEANTPLAETYYEVTRYFRGLSRFQGLGTGDYVSPVQYRCQRNFGVVVTDGLPTHDRSFPTNDPHRDNSEVTGSNNLPDWDGLKTAFGEPFSDGYAPESGSANGEGDTLYLDDIAKFAFDIDLKSAGEDSAGKSYNDLSFQKQNIRTYTIGFTVDNQMLLDAAKYGAGEYYTASDASSLSSALNSALQSIRQQISSASAIASNSTRIQNDTLIYQARYNTTDWTGEVIAYDVHEDGTVGEIVWRTSSEGKIPEPDSRKIFTFNGSVGKAFTWGNLTSEQKASLNNSENSLKWLRGSNISGMRVRNEILGDIVNSDPIFVGQQNNGYIVPNTDVANEPADTYWSYVTDKKGLTPLVIVGANDGMVHAFNGGTGKEEFAYVPASLFKNRTTSPGATPGLSALTEPDYPHHFYADGSFGLGDVYIGSAWKTYMAGGLGAGGRGVFALNVTDRENFSEDDVLWEITAPDATATTNNGSSDWNEMGHVFGEPIIARTQNDDWVTLFPNGYASNTGKAALYVVNASNGSLIKKIVVSDPDNSSLNNGLSAITAFFDSNRRITYVYAGDILGNLWKFDLASDKENSWKSQLLFKARKDGVRQPITGKVRVAAHPSGGNIVVFGTGKFLETSDKTDYSVQSLYGIWDQNKNTPVSASDLVQQTISEKTYEGKQYRIVSNNTVDWKNKSGWYVDLKVGNSTAGERVVNAAQTGGDRVLFTTFTPLSDPCLSGGESWTMALNIYTGGSLDYSAFDLNNDRYFNHADMLTCDGGQCYASGFKLEDGTLKSPGTLFSDGFDSLYNSDLSGGVEQFEASGTGSKPGRMSWRQIR
ncbi:pilus assembly protein [Pseudomonas duriflava]|nr:PilC/PilY family type IV pilus protein [Pseudomonas duriflava]